MARPNMPSDDSLHRHRAPPGPGNFDPADCTWFPVAGPAIILAYWRVRRIRRMSAKRVSDGGSGRQAAESGCGEAATRRREAPAGSTTGDLRAPCRLAPWPWPRPFTGWPWSTTWICGNSRATSAPVSCSSFCLPYWHSAGPSSCASRESCKAAFEKGLAGKRAIATAYSRLASNCARCSAVASAWYLAFHSA